MLTRDYQENCDYKESQSDLDTFNDPGLKYTSQNVMVNINFPITFLGTVSYRTQKFQAYDYTNAIPQSFGKINKQTDGRTDTGQNK